MTNLNLGRQSMSLKVWGAQVRLILSFITNFFTKNLCFWSSAFNPKLPRTWKQDGYTTEVTGPEAVSVLVATKAKPNSDLDSPLNRAFYKSFLDVSQTNIYFFNWDSAFNVPCTQYGAI